MDAGAAAAGAGAESVPASTAPDASARKKPFRFNAERDLLLLRQVMAEEPYAASHGARLGVWQRVADVLATAGVDVSGRSCHDRFDFLVAEHKRESSQALRRSGTEEEVSERTNLLDDIVEAMEEHRAQADAAAARRRSTEARLESEGERLRAAATRRMSSESGASEAVSAAASGAAPAAADTSAAASTGRARRFDDLMATEFNLRRCAGVRRRGDAAHSEPMHSRGACARTAQAGA
jgi:hypothetical protein